MTEKEKLGPVLQIQVKNGLLLPYSPMWMALKDNEEGEILSVGMVREEETRDDKTWTA